MIPIEEVRLIWNCDVALPNGFRIPQDMQPYGMTTRLDFSIGCGTESQCTLLKTYIEQVIRTNINFFLFWY